MPKQRAVPGTRAKPLGAAVAAELAARAPEPVEVVAEPELAQQAQPQSVEVTFPMLYERLGQKDLECGLLQGRINQLTAQLAQSQERLRAALEQLADREGDG